ncbi:hypothetical protein SESBI_35431 [Sesbania bispinosa]|nr:hypothetical protein SESBI_35431 [Sesbania bispinosa]
MLLISIIPTVWDLRLRDVATYRLRHLPPTQPGNRRPELPSTTTASMLLRPGEPLSISHCDFYPCL